MRLWGIAAVMAVVLVLSLSLPVMAFVPRAGGTVVVAEAIQDDLYVTGGTVEVSGEIEGDVAAAGGTVTLSGPVSGSILAAGGTVSIRGSVGRSLRAAAGSLIVGGLVGTDAVLAGGSITVDRAVEVGRDLVAAGGSVQINGVVKRNAWLAGGTITVAGTIEGNVEADAARVILLPTARISGTLRYWADQPVEIQPGAQVSGQVTRLDRPTRRGMLSPSARLGFRFAGRVLEGLWLLALGLILVAITPRGVRAVVGRLSAQFGMSLLAGFVLIIVVPVAAVLLLITILGIPVALVLMLLYVATLYPSQVFAAAWAGEAIGRRLAGGRGMSPYLAVIVGVIILVVLVAVPFVGWIFRLLAMCVGFGALWAAIWAARTRGGPVLMAGTPGAS